MVEFGRYENAMDIPGGWMQFREDGTIIQCNRYLEKLLGYASGTLEGELIGSILTGGTRVFFQTHLHPMLKLQGIAEEIYISLRSKDGEAVPVMLNGRNLNAADGSSVSEWLILRMTQRSKFEDELIEARKLAEMATAEKDKALVEQQAGEKRLRDHAERLRLATDLAGLTITLIDLVKDVAHMSSDSARLYGLGTEAVTVPRAELLATFHPEDRERIFVHIKRSMDPTNDGWFELEHRITLPDGSWRRISLQAQLYFETRDGATNPIKAILVAQDITERVRMEEELRASNLRKDEFLATLAHELRNPLAPIKSGLQLLEMPGSDAEEQQRIIAMMARQVGHMVHLVDDLMDLSRITQGKISLHKKAIDLVEVLNTAIEANKPLFAQMEHEFKVDLPRGQWHMNGDPVRVAQVLSNLLNNAAKYTPPGGRISCTLRKEKDDAIITITDNGIGIPQDQMASVFDMFAQVPLNKSASGIEGLGIGLNIVKRLVEMHQGQVKGSSAGKGQGSIFTVRLPLSTETLDTQDVDNIPAITEQRAERIMVVDDNEDGALTMSMILKKQGHEVQVAHNGEEALDLGKGFAPQVVIMDIGMPKMNGYEACALMRKTTWGRTARIVALSGWGQNEDKARSEEAGFDEHFVKPVSSSMLREMVSKS